VAWREGNKMCKEVMKRKRIIYAAYRLMAGYAYNGKSSERGSPMSRQQAEVELKKLVPWAKQGKFPWSSLANELEGSAGVITPQQHEEQFPSLVFPPEGLASPDVLPEFALPEVVSFTPVTMESAQPGHELRLRSYCCGQ
jgi:hypothetical protein